MPLTAAQIENAANQLLEFNAASNIKDQIIQDMPLLKALKARQKTFPGGKDRTISRNVKGEYETQYQGFDYDDEVSYGSPGKVKKVRVRWFELHSGIQVTYSELKEAGISVVMGGSGARTVDHSDREAIMLTDLLADKIDDMEKGSATSLNRMCWLDGTQSNKVFPGILAGITLTPTTGIYGGIDRAQATWWRNRALVGSNKVTASASSQTLSKALRKESRQLRRYGGRPDLVLAGSGFLEKLEIEVAEKGTYTQTGFINNGTLDIGLSDISMRGVGQFQYDPTLDDLGYSNFCFMIDSRAARLWVMDGEDEKDHSPDRPPEKYVLYKARTWTGGMLFEQMNCHGVYEAA